MEVVTFGETMVLLAPDRMVPLEYVNGFHKHVAGAETNVAIGLARMGHTIGWFSKLGNDPFGRYIRQFVRGHGIDTSEVRVTDEAPTGVFFKEQISPDQIQVYYYRKHSAASLMQAEELNEAYVGGARILHVTGITPALSHECRRLTFRALEAAKNTVQPLCSIPISAGSCGTEKRLIVFLTKSRLLPTTCCPAWRRGSF